MVIQVDLGTLGKLKQQGREQKTMGVTYVSRYRARSRVASKVKQVDVVLDLGAGICPQTFFEPRVHICVEAHRPYLEHIQRRLGRNRRHVLVNATWDQVIGMLPDKSVDTVFALDFIEHLEKADGLRMLREAERVARHQIVIYTPHGFFPQSYEDPNKPDRWGMNGGYWQTHRSGWEFADFGHLWDIVCCPDFLQLDQNSHRMAKPAGAIWAFRNLTVDPGRNEVRTGSWTKFELCRRMLQQGLPPIVFNGLRSAWLAFLDATHRTPH